LKKQRVSDTVKTAAGNPAPDFIGQMQLRKREQPQMEPNNFETGLDLAQEAQIVQD
jgi:hypothetical protein